MAIIKAICTQNIRPSIFCESMRVNRYTKHFYCYSFGHIPTLYIVEVIERICIYMVNVFFFVLYIVRSRVDTDCCWLCYANNTFHRANKRNRAARPACFLRRMLYLFVSLNSQLSIYLNIKYTFKFLTILIQA